jgi:cold-inducible RNA-binding protein
MSNKLYVGGLSYSTTNETLEALFERAGEVLSAQVITDRDTGRSKGFGFVEMQSTQAATDATSRFNGTELDGRTITVNEARAREPRARTRW